MGGAGRVTLCYMEQSIGRSRRLEGPQPHLAVSAHAVLWCPQLRSLDHSHPLVSRAAFLSPDLGTARPGGWSRDPEALEPQRPGKWGNLLGWDLDSRAVPWRIA